MKSKTMFVLLLCLFATEGMAQISLDDLIYKSLKKGFVLLQQDYLVLDEDDEPYGPHKDYYGRTYTCAIRINQTELLVEQDFLKPWSDDLSIPKSDKYHCTISNTAYKDIESKEMEQIELDVESAEELVGNHIYKLSGSEEESFPIDDQYGKKRGYIVWLISATNFNKDKEPTGLSLDILPFNITTNDSKSVYDLPSQPKGNVVGGAYLIPYSSHTGQIAFKVNGMMEKIGGIWKLISLGTEEPDTE